SKARFRWAWAVGFSLLIAPSRALAQGAGPGSGVDPIAPYPRNVARDLRRQYESNGGKERVAKVPSFPASPTKAGAAGPAAYGPHRTSWRLAPPATPAARLGARKAVPSPEADSVEVGASTQTLRGGVMPEIAITAVPLAGPRCLFLVGRPVAPGQWAYAAD